MGKKPNEKSQRFCWPAPNEQIYVIAPRIGFEMLQITNPSAELV
jgi:hypothetical protein